MKQVRKAKIQPEVGAAHIIEPLPTETHLERYLRWFLPPMVLSTLGFFFYHWSLTYPFQFDDIANITKFYAIRGQTFANSFFAHTRWLAYTLNAVNFRLSENPGPWLSHVITDKNPLSPFVYRFTNVSIHILTSILLFFCLYYACSRLKNKAKEQPSFFKIYAFPISLLTALLFLLHPVQTQTASYVIQGRLEGLAGFFVMSMTLCLLSFSHATSSLVKGILAAILFILTAFGCGTKEIMIVAPFLMLLIDWFFIAQGELSDLKRRWWVHAGISMIVFGLYLYWLKPEFFYDILSLKREQTNNIGNTITESRTDKIKPLNYLISEFKVILHYLWMFILPVGISVDYDWKMVKGFFAPDCIVPFFILLGIFTLIANSLKRDKKNLFAFGMLWFFIAIAPRASIMASTELIADYKTYIPSIGWLFVLASALIFVFSRLASSIALLSRRQHHAVFQLVTLSILALPIGYATYERNKVWRTAEEFWENVLANAPGRSRAHNNYGVALSEAGKFEAAIPHFKKAITMDHIYQDPWNNLAVCYSVIGKIDDAIAALKESLKINPYYPEAYNNLGSFFIQKKDYGNAQRFLSIAIQLRPWYGKAYYNRCKIYLELAQAEQDPVEQNKHMLNAWQAMKDACTKADFDTNIAGLNDYARLSMQVQKYDDAIYAFKKMLNLNPNLTEALFVMGNACFFKNDYEQAISCYHQVLQQNPQESRALNNLAETYYKMERYAQALEIFNQVQQKGSGSSLVLLRIADCLDRTGKSHEAKKVLQDCASSAELPDQIKNMAQLALAQMNNKSTKKKSA